MGWDIYKNDIYVPSAPTGEAGSYLKDDLLKLRDYSPKSAFNQDHDPSSSDNFAAGWEVGSVWFRTSTQIFWDCTGNGTWKKRDPLAVLADDMVAGRNALGAVSGIWPISVGGTAASTAADARTNLDVQQHNSLLDAIVGLSSTGFIVRTSSSAAQARSLVAPSAGFTISNSNGVSGNPTFVLANDLAGLEGLSGTGYAKRTGTDTWSPITTIPVADGGTGTTDRTLTDGGAVLSVDWGNRLLKDTSSVLAVDWLNRWLVASNAATALDWDQLVFFDPGTSNQVFDMINRRGYSYVGATSLDFGNCLLYDDYGESVSIDWHSRALYAADGTTPLLDWTDPLNIQVGSASSHRVNFVAGTDFAGSVDSTPAGYLAVLIGGVGDYYIPYYSAAP